MKTFHIYWETDEGEWQGPLECTADSEDDAHRVAEDCDAIQGRYRIESA